MMKTSFKRNFVPMTIAASALSVLAFGVSATAEEPSGTTRKIVDGNGLSFAWLYSRSSV